MEELAIGEQMPMGDYEMLGTDDKTYSLNGIKGEKGTLVVFSCNTCPYVIAWQDRYNPLAELCQASGIGMLAVNPNEDYRDGDDSPEAMKAHAEKNGYIFPYVIDTNHKLADAMGATRTPHIYLFDANNTLVYRGAIDDNYRDAAKVEQTYLQDAIRALAEGQEITKKTSKSLGCSIKRLTD
jgi:peroxiredoxin